MQHNTDKEKATACQKTPGQNPNMKTDTQPTHKIVTSGDISYVVTSDIDAALDRQACFNRMHYAQGQEAIAKREATAYKAQADKLAEALRGLIAEVKLGKLNVRKDFSLMNAHAYAGKCLHQYESDKQ